MNNDLAKAITQGRIFLKHPGFELYTGEHQSDQISGISPPPLQKPYDQDATLLDLPSPETLQLGDNPLIDIINSRASVRKYSDASLSLDELSFLLWITQGVQSVSNDKVRTKRTVPSGGARHPFETYLVVNRVDGLATGIYRYLPLNHKLLFISDLPENHLTLVSEAAMGQSFVSTGAVVFIWSVIPYRAEWRYSAYAHKAIALDAGHLCQNLYLGCGAINAGTCAIAAYDQAKTDSLLGLDGTEEFTIYLSPVGKLS
ncbi:MAG: SagB/ThcOx family dehydrogenase [Candidatus Kariarchaeaceae archaeon]